MPPATRAGLLCARPGAIPASSYAAPRLTALLTVLAVAVAMLLTGAITASPADAAAPDVATNAEDTFTASINQARDERGIPRLSTNPALVSVARDWAATMASQGTLRHNPDLTSQVTNWRWVGENVGYGPDAATVHVAFMNSPGHRANILDRDYTEIGVGAVVRDGRVWVAEVFRRPLEAAASGTAASFRHTLRYGSTGAAVRQLQARLGLTRTGFYSHRTQAAVSRFQKRQGWAGRGNCGPRTWNHLF